MELFGGFTIMLILLGLCIGATLVSLPVLIWGLSRRIEVSLATLARLEERADRMEQQLANKYDSAVPSAVSTDQVIRRS